MARSYDCNWPSFPYVYKPLWPRHLYVAWINSGRGTEEQRERYKEAVAWYDGKRQPEEKRPPLRQDQTPKPKPKRKKRLSFDERQRLELEKLERWSK
jgi:hypothetical protein